MSKGARVGGGVVIDKREEKDNFFFPSGAKSGEAKKLL